MRVRREEFRKERTFRGDAAALSDEEKIRIVNAWDLLDRTRQRASMVRGMDMTWRMQLNSDCKALEKILRTIEKHPDPVLFQKLEKAYLALQTSADNILAMAEDDE